MDNIINGWEYKETVTKSGKTIVFGKLDELLKSYYKVSTVDSLAPFRSSYKEQYIINCPFCAAEKHTKKKLHIYPNTPGQSDFTEGYCFVCGRTFIHITDEVDIHYRVPDFLKFNTQFELAPITDKYWTLDKFNEFDYYSERGINYLVHRNPFLRELWKPLGFRFYEDHVAMPFIDPDGNFIYYQIRFIDATKDFGVRFHFPITSAKPPYIIQSSNADPGKLLICEGIFDCIAAWIQCGGKYICIALMGSKVSDYQLAFIRNWYMPQKIVYWLDETELSIQVKNRFNTVFNYSDHYIIKSDGDDPEETLIKRMRREKSIIWIPSDYGEIRKSFYPKFKLGLNFSGCR